MSPAFRDPPRLEAVPATKYRSFKLHSFAKPKFDFIWHHHPEVELTYIVRGHGVRYVGDSILPFHAGDLCLIGDGAPHAYGSHPRMRGGAEWMVLHFLPDRFGPAFWQLPETQALRQLLDAARSGLRFRGPGVERCVRLLRGLAAPATGLEGLAGFLALFGGLQGVAAPIALNPRGKSGGGTARPRLDPRLQKVLAWMESAGSEGLSQERAARLLRMSPAAFSRFFRSQTGRTFVRHLNELRVARACVSLAAADRRVTEIALESGFGNLSNFNRRFKEIVGLTPLAYRASFPADGSPAARV